MEQSYWGRNGKHQVEADRITKLMPSRGNCETVAGELIRAATKLYYDFNNNGMGNNTSGAVNFLQAKDAISEGTYETIHPWTRGQVYNGSYDGGSLCEAMENVISETVEYILANPELETTDNTEDMFDLQECEQNFCECGDLLEDDHYGYHCDSCEELQEEEENKCEGCYQDLRYNDCDCEEEDED